MLLGILLTAKAAPLRMEFSACGTTLTSKAAALAAAKTKERNDIMDATPRGKQDLGDQGAQKAQELRERASALGANAWNQVKMGCSAVQEKTVAGAQAAGKTIRSHPYQAIGIAFGMGLLVGYLARRKS
jgi:ElaB/YqjD/DUF883 family membrane-anchored ribosome-binding protein